MGIENSDTMQLNRAAFDQIGGGVVTAADKLTIVLPVQTYVKYEVWDIVAEMAEIDTTKVFTHAWVFIFRGKVDNLANMIFNPIPNPDVNNELLWAGVVQGNGKSAGKGHFPLSSPAFADESEALTIVLSAPFDSAASPQAVLATLSVRGNAIFRGGKGKTITLE
jgi:hypothetical protein